MLKIMNNLAFMYWHQGCTADAAVLFRNVLDKRRELLGEAQADIILSIQWLGHISNVMGKTKNAL